MGLSLEFLLGDTESIIRAFAEEDFDILDEPGVVEASADLSLHIVPADLDRLSVCMARYSGLPATQLRPHLEVQVDEPDHGVLTVSSAWLQYAAAVPADQDRRLVEDWAAQMATDWTDPEIKVSEEALQMVSQFLALCRRANQEKRILVHTWVG